MLLNVIALVFCVLVGAFWASRFKGKNLNIQLPLVFAASFLFSITIIHILPELFVLSDDPHYIGLWLLVGFFIQRILEFFSRGVEHGHSHTHGQMSASAKFSILIALTIHSIMEGSLLTHESPFHHQHESYSLLLGIVLHKIPAAFALAILMEDSKWKWWLISAFALGSPFGLLLSNQIALADHILLPLFGVVCGSFLHISTTIFVETSPEHRLSWKKTIISLAAAAIAIITEYFI